MTRNGVYLILLTALSFLTLVFFWKIFSANDNSFKEEPWIDPESRKVLERLDIALVDVLDRLFVEKDTNDERVLKQIERRLCIFPFLARDKETRTETRRIIHKVLKQLRPDEIQDSIKPEWAMNRMDAYYEI